MSAGTPSNRPSSCSTIHNTNALSVSRLDLFDRPGTIVEHEASAPKIEKLYACVCVCVGAHTSQHTDRTKRRDFGHLGYAEIGLMGPSETCLEPLRILSITADLTFPKRAI